MKSKLSINLAVVLISALVSQPTAMLKAAEQNDATPKVAPNAQKPPVDVRGDGGVEAVQQTQAETGGEHYRAGATAQNLIADWLYKDGYKEGWVDDKKRFIAIGVGEFNSEDPLIDPGKFCLNREIALQRALLDARASIVEFANSKMDVLLQAETPGTDLNAAFGEEKEVALRRLVAQQKVVAQLLEDVDKTEADALAGVTSRDRANAMMDAAIKKLDATYNTQNIEEAKRIKFANAEKRYAESLAELQKVEDKIKKSAASLTRSFSSKISKLAKMPLFGSTCIYQTESWDANAEKYTVEVALVWSVGLEKVTRAIIQGQDVIIDTPKKGVPLDQWLHGQDLGAMVGPRTFMDDKGQRYFIGIAARPIVSQASRKEKNRDIARLQADGMAILSLRADVEVAKTAEEMAQTFTSSDNKENENAMESLSKKVQSKLEGQNINGLGRIYETEVNHTLTGIKILVTISGIDPVAVKAARTMEEINYAAAIAASKENSRLQGRKGQLEDSKKATKYDPASHVQGRKNAVTGLQEQQAERDGQLNKRVEESKQAEALKVQLPNQSQTLDGAAGSRPTKSDDDF